MRQVTDRVHETIFLSELESELIATPYFYRLHDIYQSSTVYMTFPSNRTKRYEHSLGTMELASSMLFSAVSNASQETRDELFKKLRFHFGNIFDLAICRSGSQVAEYFTKYRNKIDEIFMGLEDDQDSESMLQCIISNDIRIAVANGCFADSALDHFQYYQLNVESKSDADNIENLFLYRCLLQAVRIVALFHDVGHPPYSHIIEDVLKKLYEKSQSTECGWNTKKNNAFQQIMKRYATQNEQESYKCQTIYNDTSLPSSALHERIGLSLLQLAINDVIPELLSEVADSDKGRSCKISSILYYIFVVELAIGMLVEKNNFFKSFHKIVDGILDADRLDYIMRDSLNSGVDWGKVPYKRLINSAKLIFIKKDLDGNKLSEEDQVFVIAHPKKVSDDIVDLLLTRYKIFARINFHHRCMKTSVALQSAVLELAEDYLKNPKEKEINSEINVLWSALNMGAGDRRIRIIQWNDSWLISVLHKALVRIMLDKKKEKALRENLEEILLNKKRYYTLIKRGSDSQAFVHKIFEYADISDERLEKLKQKEYEKYYSTKKADEKVTDILKEPDMNAEESLIRIRDLEKIKKSGDLELLNSLMPLKGVCVNDTIRDALEIMKSKALIEDYKVFTNDGRRKTGLPSHKTLLDEIYLYDNDRYEVFDDGETLKPQISSIEKSVPWTYIYFVPSKSCKDIEGLSKKIFDETAKAVGYSLRKRYCELFGE